MTLGLTSSLAVSAWEWVGVKGFWSCVGTAASLTDKQVVTQKEGDGCSDQKSEGEESRGLVFIQKINFLYSSPKKQNLMLRDIRRQFRQLCMQVWWGSLLVAHFSVPVNTHQVRKSERKGDKKYAYAMRFCIT